MEQKSLSSEQGTVHYWIGGQDGEWIIFTHGATMDHALFRAQVEHFAAQHRVIVWDVPAHGQSRPYTGFTLQAAADELIRVMDREGVEKAHLVGQSMGGYISQIVARQHPERVQTLTAVGSSPMQRSYYTKLDAWLLAITPSVLRLFPDEMLSKTVAEQITSQERSQQYAFETLQQLSKAEIADIMRVVYEGMEAYSEDGALPLPILVTYGESDRTGRIQSYSQAWAEEENRPLRVIPDAAHNANMDNPQAFNQILDDFLQANVAGANK